MTKDAKPSYQWEFETAGQPLKVSVLSTTYLRQPRIYVEIEGFHHPSVNVKNYVGEESRNPALKEPVEYLKHIIQNGLDGSLKHRDMEQYHVDYGRRAEEGTDFQHACDSASLYIDFKPSQGKDITPEKLGERTDNIVQDLRKAIDDAIPAVDRIIKKNQHLQPDIENIGESIAAQKAYDAAQAEARHMLVQKGMMSEGKGPGPAKG